MTGNECQYFLISASLSSKSSSLITFFVSFIGSNPDAGACFDSAIEYKRMVSYARNLSRMISIDPNTTWLHNPLEPESRVTSKTSKWKTRYECIENQPSLIYPYRFNMKYIAPIYVAASLPSCFFSRICLNSLQMINKNLSKPNKNKRMMIVKTKDAKVSNVMCTHCARANWSSSLFLGCVRLVFCTKAKHTRFCSIQ